MRNNPIEMYDQDVEGELRVLHYGETKAGRLLAIVATQHDDRVRVVTAYDLDAGQKRMYLEERIKEDW